MQFTFSLVASVLAATAAATNVHNWYGIDGGCDYNGVSSGTLKNNGVISTSGGWIFWYPKTGPCANNGATYTWPTNYGDVYIWNDGYMHDASGNQIGSAHVCSNN